MSGKCVTWWSETSGYTLAAHAHLLGSDCVTKHDLFPSAILCVSFFLVGTALALKWFGLTWFGSGESRYAVIIIMGVACILTGLGFAIRAGVANTSSALVSHVTVSTEQIFFMFGELLLIDSHVVMSRDLVAKWGVTRPSTWIYVNHLLVLVSFILYFISFVRLPYQANATNLPPIDTSLRIAASVLPLFLTVSNALWLPLEKVKSPDMPWLGLGILTLVAWFLAVPAFYAFLAASVSADDSPLVASTTWFYIAFGLLQILAVAPFLGVPLDDFALGPWATGRPIPIENLMQEEGEGRAALLEP